MPEAQQEDFTIAPFSPFFTIIQSDDSVSQEKQAQ